jgi:hypothetical protein
MTSDHRRNIVRNLPCPVERCTEARDGAGALAAHLVEAHGMRGGTALLAARAVEKRKTGARGSS